MKYIIAEYKPVTMVWYYEVEAESEDEALEKFSQDEEAESDDFEIIDNISEDFEYEIVK